MTLSANLRKFASASSFERFLFLSSLVMLPAASLSLRCVGLKRCRSILERLAPATSGLTVQTAQLERARATARMVRAAASHNFYSPKCLPQSLVLWWLLRHQGVVSELKIGMQKEMGDLKGHAWIEIHGEVMNDDPDVAQRFYAFVAWNPSDLPNR